MACACNDKLLDGLYPEVAIAGLLVHHPRVVVIPHLVAMTEEAQTRAAIEVAEQVVSIPQSP